MRITTLITLLLAFLVFGIVSCSEENAPVGPVTSGNGGGDDDDDDPPVDDNPPLPVTEIRIFYSLDDRVATVRWTAPQDDEPDEAVTRYEIRYAFTRGYYPPEFWGLAAPVNDPPDPGAPGVEQFYEFPNPALGRDLWVGIRSYDEANNGSPPSDLVTVKIPGLEVSGVCTDALTGLPIAGLEVRVSDVGVYTTSTDGAGRYSVGDLSPGTINVRITTGDAAGLYHGITQSTYMPDDGERDFVVIPYDEPISPDLAGSSLLAVFKFITETDGGSNAILAKWRELPVPVYAPNLVNKYGLDYKAAMQEAANTWMSVTGIELFTFVDSRPAVGVSFRYPNPEEIAPLIGLTSHTNDSEGHPIRDDVVVANNLQSDMVLYRVMLHEIGHTIRFGHFTTPGFIMYGGQPLPNEISPDEVNLVKLHASLPTRVDMEIYDDAVPSR